MRNKFLLVLLSLSFLVSCGSVKSDPVTVVKKYHEALGEFDFKKAKTFATANGLSTIEAMEEYFTVKEIAQEDKAKWKEDAFNSTYKIVNQTENTATVAIHDPKKPDNEPLEVYLKKDNNKWLIDGFK